MSDSHLMERAQSAEAALTTCRAQIDRVNEKCRNLKAMLGAKERSDGTIDIDFSVLVENLSTEHALALRAAIDERHRISGAAGAKPRVSVRA